VTGLAALILLLIPFRQGEQWAHKSHMLRGKARRVLQVDVFLSFCFLLQAQI
jgi:hypothetical protein